jgi:archaellum component FlaC
MTGALGMQSQQELELLRREVAATGLITQSLSDSYQALLPEMTQLTNMAAAESAEIVAELQARKITMDQARAKIAALNATVESMMGEVATGVAATQGRAINLTQLPLVNQPAFDPITGKANMKELTRPRNRTLLNKIAQSLGVKTFGAPYSIETTRPKRFNMGGKVFFNNGDQVPGFGNTDTVPAMLTPGEFVIRKGVAQQDPEGMRALNDGQAMVVPVQNRNVGGIINVLRAYSARSRSLSGLRTGLRADGTSGRSARNVNSPESFSFEAYSRNRIPGAGLSSLVGGNAITAEEAAILKGMVGAHASGRDFQISTGLRSRSGVYPSTNVGNVPNIFPNLSGSYTPTGRSRSSFQRESNLPAQLLPGAMVHAPLKFNNSTRVGLGASRDDLGVVQGFQMTSLLDFLTSRGVSGSDARIIANTAANRLNRVLPRERITENVWAKSIQRAEQGALVEHQALLSGITLNSGGIVPSMGGSVTMQGGKTIPVPAQNGKYNMGGMVTGYMRGGGIPSLSASTISRLTSRWKPKEQFWPQGHQYMLGNQDPLHGPLQIGKSMVPRQYAANPEFTREVIFKDDRFARQNVMQQFPIGTMEDRGKYILRQYMSGNYGVLNTPGATEAMKTLSKKFSGTLYRGIRLSDNRENPIPQNIISAIEKARLTGDNSGLMGQEFIMRRSSWSAKSGVAGLFAPGYGKDPTGKSILLEANVKNRNVVPASEIFPDVKFAPPFGQKLTTNNYRSEHESIFGGKFKVVGFSGGKLQLETVVDGARAMGGPVNSGRPYLVGENGPEIFVPRNAGGIIPGYQDGGAVGAFSAGLKNPYGKSLVSGMSGGSMGIGPQMAISMGGMMAGQAVGGPAGMAIMMASNILPMMGALRGFAGLVPSVTKVAGILGRLTVPGAIVGTLTGIISLVNKFRQDAENAGEINRAMFGGTKEQLAEVGVSYTSISDRIKDINTQLELNKAKIESSYNSFTKSGIPGLTLTIQELKDGIEKAKTSAKETVNLFNNADTSQVNELATSMKAQYVAMGMSVEEATNTIYTLVAASNKSKQALGAISSSGFKDIIDQASAATSQVQKLGKVIQGSLKFNAEEFNVGMDAVLNGLNSYKDSLTTIKDENGKVKTETEALAETIEKIKGTAGATSTINKQNLEAYKLQNLEMASILGKSESILSIFSKYQLVAAGLSDVMDISAMSGAQAISVAAGYQKVKDAASAVIAETTIGKLVAARLKNQTKLQGLIKSSGDQDSSYYDNAIKQKQKLIEILEEERKKRLAILDIQEQSQSFETAIKQAQIKYQEALASGNMAQAAAEQLNIQKLRSDRERELARQAINDKADADRKRLEDEIERLQNLKDAKAKATSNAVAGSQRATEDLQAAKDFEAKIVGIVAKYGGKFSADAQKALAVAFNDAKASKDAGLAAAATQMEKQYITGSKTYQGSPGTAPVTVTKDKYQSMFENLSTSTFSQANTESNSKFKKAVEDFVSAVNIFTGKDKSSPNKSFDRSASIQGKPGGTVEKIGGITYIYDNIGKKYDVTSQKGLSLRTFYRKAMGGYISGPGSATSDSIPAMLSNGEYVINAKSVQAAGIPMLDKINKMAMGGPVYNIPAYSMGGRVKYNAGGLANSSNSLYNINVTLNGTDLSADDVANAIERKMRIREATIGRGRNN